MDKKHPPMPEPHPSIAAHIAKRAFLAFLPIFAGFWQEAADAAPVGSLNAKLWPDYLRLLRACQDVLSHAPMHPNEARQINVERRLVRSIERIATTLAGIFPNGFLELETYVIAREELTWRRHGKARYKRAKRSRSRRKR